MLRNCGRKREGEKGRGDDNGELEVDLGKDDTKLSSLNVIAWDGLRYFYLTAIGLGVSSDS